MSVPSNGSYGRVAFRHSWEESLGLRKAKYLVLVGVVVRVIWRIILRRKPIASPEVSKTAPTWATNTTQQAARLHQAPTPQPVDAQISTSEKLIFGRAAGALTEFSAGRKPVWVRDKSGDLTYDVIGFAKARGELAEDAFAFSKAEPIFALADGASSSSQAGEWAVALCKLWVNSHSAWSEESLAENIAPLQDEFTGTSVAVEDSPSTWFAEEVSRRGAHAAFLGVRIVPSDKRGCEVHAVSYGDVCMLVYTKDRLVQSFPIAEHTDFSSFPALLSSNEIPSAENLLISTFAVEPGSRVILATDGVASLLLHPKVSRSTVRAVISGTAKQCGKKLMEARETGLLDDDDYTLIRIVVT